MRIVKVDGPKGAPRRARADRAAVADPGEALKGLAVRGKGARVVVEGRGQLVACVEGVDGVVAGAGCVGAGAEEDLFLFLIKSVKMMMRMMVVVMIMRYREIS